MGTLTTPTETRFTKALDRRVLKFIERRRVIKRGESLVAGVSGGPDSTALLLILARLRAELGVTLAAAHFDHGLRSLEEARGDRRFVEGLCGALDIPIASGDGDVAARARRERESVEGAARVLRYRFLEREAGRTNATAVLVGHTRDDRAETVLLHVIRGSGLDGLAAMSPRAPWPFGRGPELVRPLIEVSRDETERYCRESGIEPRLDPTNDMLIATRNRVRHELMPVLRSLNPRIAEALVRLADAAAIDAVFINEWADVAWKFAAGRDGEGVILKRRDLERWPGAVTVRLLRRAVAVVAGRQAELDAEHIQQLLGSLGRRHCRTSLPGGLVAVTDASLLRICRGEPRPPAGIWEVPVEMPGRTHAGEWTIDAKLVSPPKRRLRLGPLEAMLDVTPTRGVFIVRSRRPGDRLRPMGLGGSKKLQDILMDAKVPEGERDEVPIVVDEQGIIWVVGHCIDERVAVTAATQHVLRLRARRSRGRRG